MRLLIIHKDNRYVCDIIVNGKLEDDSIILSFLEGQPKETVKSAKGMKVLFKRYAELGREGVTANLFHEVDKNEKIWEFIKGKLRVLCFIDQNRVILTCGYLKKTNKVDQSAVAKAVKIKQQYFKAKKDGKLEVMENEE